MRNPITPMFSRKLLAGAAMAGLTLASATAHAQSVDELTVTGRLGADSDVRSLSQPVSFADLDLTVRSDQDVLKMRIKDTAQSLCRELGESNNNGSALPSCEEAARDGAMKQARMAIASATPRDLGVTASIADTSAPPAYAPSAESYETNVSATAPAATYSTTTVTNGPVADTPENRALYGGPQSNAGQRTAPTGN